MFHEIMTNHLISTDLVLFPAFSKIGLIDDEAGTYFAKCLKGYGPNVREAEAVDEGI